MISRLFIPFLSNFQRAATNICVHHRIVSIQNMPLIRDLYSYHRSFNMISFILQTWPFSFQRCDSSTDVGNDRDLSWNEVPSQSVIRDKDISYYY